jgi:hypothetical protein
MLRAAGRTRGRRIRFVVSTGRRCRRGRAMPIVRSPGSTNATVETGTTRRLRRRERTTSREATCGSSPRTTSTTTPRRPPVNVKPSERTSQYRATALDPSNLVTTMLHDRLPAGRRRSNRN